MKEEEEEAKKKKEIEKEKKEKENIRKQREEALRREAEVSLLFIKLIIRIIQFLQLIIGSRKSIKRKT